MAAGGQGMFGEAHGFLRSMAEEVEAVKRLIASEDAKRVKEIDELRRDQEAERFEAREDLFKMRCELEGYVRTRIEAVLQQINEMKSGAGGASSAKQSGKLEELIEDFTRMKDNLFLVQSSWGKLIATCVDGEDQQHKRHLESVEESQVALRPQLDRAASKQMVDRLARSPLAGAPTTPDHSTSRTERGEDRIPALIDRTLVRSGSKDPR